MRSEKVNQIEDRLAEAYAEQIKAKCAAVRLSEASLKAQSALTQAAFRVGELESELLTELRKCAGL